MTFIEVLLNVLAIIGIVAVGGFVIYFLGGIVLSILESKRDKEETTATRTFSTQPTQTEEKEVKPFVAAVEYAPEQDTNQEATYEDTLTDESFKLDEDEKVENVDFAKATEEKKSLNQEETKFEEESNNLFNDEKEFNFDDFDFDAFFNEQNQNLEVAQEEPAQEEPVLEEVKKEEAKVEPVVEETPVVEAQNAEVIKTETDEMPVSVVAESFASEQTAVTSEVVNTTEVSETIKTVYVENTELENALREEIAALRAELEEQKKLYEALKADAETNQKKWEEEKTNLEVLYAEAEKRQQEEASKSRESLSIEEYEARLALLNERLKVNESELRANRKEFMPLKRVRKNLDKDKSKLRRREALVAKQKVLLYGVNNIAEIDQEKAKKLAEDLDLLDGLKVSVRHCEEVMEANKERYPILETANRILVTTNEELKADILACERAIRKLRGEDVSDMELTQITLTEVPVKRKRGRPRKVQTEQVEAKEDKKVELQDINVQEIMQTINADETILHTAQIEAEKARLREAEMQIAEETFDEVFGRTNMALEAMPAEQPAQEVVVSFEETQPAQKQTTVSLKKEQTTITQTTTSGEVSTTTQATKTTHQFDFDADEPSMEDLFAIENEDLFDFGEDNKDSKK